MGEIIKLVGRHKTRPQVCVPVVWVDGVAYHLRWHMTPEGPDWRAHAGGPRGPVAIDPVLVDLLRRCVAGGVANDHPAPDWPESARRFA